MRCDVGEATEGVGGGGSADSPTLPLLHLRHSPFSNPSFASPTSQALHLRHLASRPWLNIKTKNRQDVTVLNCDEKFELRVGICKKNLCGQWKHKENVQI